MTEQTKDIPTVTLGGREWPVPEFVIAQLRDGTRRKIIALNALLFVTGEDGKYDGKAGERFEAMSDEHLDDMLDVVWQGLRGSEPNLKRADFDALRFRDVDLLTAFIVMRRQSGVFVFAKEGEPSPAGEAQAEAAAA